MMKIFSNREFWIGFAANVFAVIVAFVFHELWNTWGLKDKFYKGVDKLDS